MSKTKSLSNKSVMLDDDDINDFQIFQKGELFDSDVVYTHTECRVKENSKDEATE